MWRKGPGREKSCAGWRGGGDQAPQGLQDLVGYWSSYLEQQEVGGREEPSRGRLLALDRRELPSIEAEVIEGGVQIQGVGGGPWWSMESLMDGVWLLCGV